MPDAPGPQKMERLTSHDVLTRDEVLAGLGGRRARHASTLLFLIEARTVHASARAEQLAEVFPTGASASELDRAYFQAIAESRELVRRPSIQEIERFASAWSDLVPPDPTLRASVAHTLGERYAFTAQAAPRLRAALGLDLAPVQEAYLQRYGKPLATIYAPRVAPGARLRWQVAGVGAWLEGLPPFWQACVSVLALSFPQAALALSIATAGIGPIAGVGLLVVFGLLNMLTVAALAEAVARNGAIRYGNAFLGRVAADYLGPAGSVVLTVAAGAFMFLAHIAAVVGLATTLASFTAGPTTIWAAMLFGVNAYRLATQSKVSLSITIILAGLDLLLLLVLSALAFAHFHPDYLRLPALGGAGDQALKPAALQALLGVLLTAYYGQLMVSQVGRAVLPRDPSGRALIRGSAAAFGVMTGIFVLWVLAVSNAVAPQVLANTSGTVLVPLATELGPAAQLLASPIAIFLLGLASIRTADVLFNLARERLPVERPATRLDARGRLALSISPVLVAFVATEWLLVTGTGSFARIISLAGVLTVSLCAGIFPILLLVASRRKGDLVPTTVPPLLGHPLLVGGIYVVFLGIILLHGLVIWQELVERALALSVAVVVVVLTLYTVRRGAFAPRAVVELRQELRDPDTGIVSITAAGRPCAARVRLDYGGRSQNWEGSQGTIPSFSRLRAATLELPTESARELKVWAHRVALERTSAPLPVLVDLVDGADRRRVDLAACGGQVVVSLTGSVCRLEFTLSGHSA
ncbi:MAG TPA: hypothetical protein VFA49_09455 [Chloroflexota bacterium]|nr:hypothetical protein [Chloroflexota bacterium]